MVNDVISTFDASQREQMKAEARKWRLPYWDWAAKKQRPGKGNKFDTPLILKDEYVKVFKRTGEETIPNPMWQFNTPEPMGKWNIEPVLYKEKPDKAR